MIFCIKQEKGDTLESVVRPEPVTKIEPYQTREQ
ncbi:unnamed protein product [Linum tenue]|uniref:Uncharacterized protein n=1 Tax=Linum tenue TaxID=586396 RepID=A0AAV0QDM6_9ROSI|nr:unnamed protein product [Linum tenue]